MPQVFAPLRSAMTVFIQQGIYFGLKNESTEPEIAWTRAAKFCRELAYGDENKDKRIFKFNGKIAGYWIYLETIDTFLIEFNAKGLPWREESLFRHVLRKERMGTNS